MFIRKIRLTFPQGGHATPRICSHASFYLFYSSTSEKAPYRSIRLSVLIFDMGPNGDYILYLPIESRNFLLPVATRLLGREDFR